MLVIVDISLLLELIDELIDTGSTIVIIEHNLDVISAADWIIDIGPDAGHPGGQVVFSGPSEAIFESEKSYTAKHLRIHMQDEHNDSE